MPETGFLLKTRLRESRADPAGAKFQLKTRFLWSPAAQLIPLVQAFQLKTASLAAASTADPTAAKFPIENDFPWPPPA